MAAKKAQNDQEKGTKSTTARLEDGTIQVTLTIPQENVKKAREVGLAHLIEKLEIPGFRKGKAPTDIALKHIDKQKIFDGILEHVLPKAYTQALKEHNLQPITSPRFELLSTDDDKDWSIRVVICELPNVELGNYKKSISTATSSNTIWVPGKDSSAGPLVMSSSPNDSDKAKKPSKEEKEQLVIKTLIEETKVNVPRPLIEDEVSHRLSQLIDQTQRLGLTVEQYLSSTGKSTDQVKKDYELQANDSIKLLLVLNKIAEEEKIAITDDEINQIFQASFNATSDKTVEGPRDEQKRYIKSLLLRRKALDSLVSLI